MRKTLIAIVLAATMIASSALANDDDYSLELYPAACKAATARIVKATGGVGVDTANQLGSAIFEIAGNPPVDFSIDCRSSPKMISAYISLGLNESLTQWVTVAARIAHGLTGDRLSAAADAVEKCLDSAAQDVRFSSHADLKKTHFDCWTAHLEEGRTAGVTIKTQEAFK